MISVAHFWNTKLFFPLWKTPKLCGKKPLETGWVWEPIGGTSRVFFALTDTTLFDVYVYDFYDANRVNLIEILGLEGESMNEKWTINPCRQGKLDLGVIPADRLGCFLLKTFFLVFIKWCSLSMSAGVNPMNFWLIWSSCMHKCILLLVVDYSDFYG
jgi:hypothetical protein